MLKFILVAALMGLSPFAMAGGPTFVIKQIQLARQRVVVESSSEIEPGTELIASFKNGSQCTLPVTAAQGRLANADVSECASAQAIHLGGACGGASTLSPNPAHLKSWRSSVRFALIFRVPLGLEAFR